MPGRDAIPLFTTVRAYDRYYACDTACNGDDACVRRLYATLRLAGSIELVSLGEPVVVLGFASGSEDKSYKVCRVRYHGRSRVVLCIALNHGDI